MSYEQSQHLIHDTYSCDPMLGLLTGFFLIGPWPIEVVTLSVSIVVSTWRKTPNHPRIDVLVGIVADWQWHHWWILRSSPVFACCSDKSSLQKLRRLKYLVWNLRIYGQGWTGLKVRRNPPIVFFLNCFILFVWCVSKHVDSAGRSMV